MPGGSAGTTPPVSPEVSRFPILSFIARGKLVTERSACPTVEIWATIIAPRAATPNAALTCLIVLFAAEATPDFWYGTLARTVFVSSGTERQNTSSNKRKNGEK